MATAGGRPVPSFDHLVGAGKQRVRHRQAERLRGLEVDHQLEPRGLYHGQICGLRAVENPAGVGANLPICVVTPVRFPWSVDAVDEAVLPRLIAAGEDDWSRQGRWREALKVI
jgi:hypothetical protein